MRGRLQNDPLGDLEAVAERDGDWVVAAVHSRCVETVNLAYDRKSKRYVFLDIMPAFIRREGLQALSAPLLEPGPFRVNLPLCGHMTHPEAGT